jgi:hypothetical protein
MHGAIDFKNIAAAALACARSLLPELVPDGRFEGDEYVALNPSRADKNLRSFKINSKSGKWSDFATGAKGGDIISWYAHAYGLDQGEAARRMVEKLGTSPHKREGSKEQTTKRPPKIYPYGEEGPPVERNEIRRHYYPKNGKPRLKVKIKKRDVPKNREWITCYRVFRNNAPVGWQWEKPTNYRSVPYAAPGTDTQKIFWPEGEKDNDTLNKFGFSAFTFGGGDGLPDDIDEYLKRILRDDRTLIIPIDNDVGGRQQGLKKAQKAYACGINQIRIFDPATAWPECPKGGDITDWFERGGGTREKLIEIVDALPDWQPSADPGGFEGFEGPQGRRFSASEAPNEWPEPKPLPNGLSPVDAFDIRFLPDAIAPWVMDIANRLQCLPDYVGVSAMVGLGATIGRRVGINPQMHTDWIEFANLWGAFVGRPGWLKSPAMGEALKPLHHLEAQAIKNNDAAQQVYLAELSTFRTRQQVKLSLDKEALKKDPQSKADSGIDLGDEPKKPPNIRYRTNDSSYESLGELLIDNPAGILVERDELVSLLQHLDREEQSVARGFYLSSWSGAQPYTFDRIGRGHRHIEAVCLSVLGNTQPARISEYVRRANRDGAGGDGLLQRFGLLVWPDAAPDWKNVDEYPDSSARENAWVVFERASKLDQNKALAMGASQGKFDKVPAFHFDEAALGDFEDFRGQLERRVRSGELSPAFEGHIAKYRKLVPALALINHIADGGDGPVTQKSLLRALAFVTYLESHAQRVYGSTSESELAAAKAILKRIQSGDLPDGFTARDVHQKGWAHLTEREHVGAGLNLLVDLYYIAEINLGTGPQGGRPKVGYSINPRIAS